MKNLLPFSLVLILGGIVGSLGVFFLFPPPGRPPANCPQTSGEVDICIPSNLSTVPASVDVMNTMVSSGDKIRWKAASSFTITPKDSQCIPAQPYVANAAASGYATILTPAVRNPAAGLPGTGI